MKTSDLGQLLIVGISGLSLTEWEKIFLEDKNIGGVILFKYNYQDPAQLAELVNEIQSLRDEYPLFISVDQEGGRVRRFQNHFTQFPSMHKVGQKDSPKLTFEVHKTMAEELALCGINLNFSPVCDVWTNPKNKVIGDRAFGSTIETVEKHISAAIRGLHTGNVLACAKHFPGHGDTLKDSHIDLPFVKKSLDELKELELSPFIKASKARAEFLMMSHLVVDALDTEFPCTLSKKAYTYLREYLKYKKLIITDDMEMNAITDNYTLENAGALALAAGADILCYRTCENAAVALQGIKQAFKIQKINKSDVESKLKRIENCKKQYLKDYKPIYIPDIEKGFKKINRSVLLDDLAQE